MIKNNQNSGLLFQEEDEFLESLQKANQDRMYFEHQLGYGIMQNWSTSQKDYEEETKSEQLVSKNQKLQKEAFEDLGEFKKKLKFIKLEVSKASPFYISILKMCQDNNNTSYKREGGGRSQIQLRGENKFRGDTNYLLIKQQVYDTKFEYYILQLFQKYQDYIRRRKFQISSFYPESIYSKYSAKNAHQVKTFEDKDRLSFWIYKDKYLDSIVENTLDYIDLLSSTLKEVQSFIFKPRTKTLMNTLILPKYKFIAFQRIKQISNGKITIYKRNTIRLLNVGENPIVSKIMKSNHQEEGGLNIELDKKYEKFHFFDKVHSYDTVDLEGNPIRLVDKFFYKAQFSIDDDTNIRTCYEIFISQSQDQLPQKLRRAFRRLIEEILKYHYPLESPEKYIEELQIVCTEIKNIEEIYNIVNGDYFIKALLLRVIFYEEQEQQKIIKLKQQQQQEQTPLIRKAQFKKRQNKSQVFFDNKCQMLNNQQQKLQSPGGRMQKDHPSNKQDISSFSKVKNQPFKLKMVRQSQAQSSNFLLLNELRQQQKLRQSQQNKSSSKKKFSIEGHIEQINEEEILNETSSQSSNFDRFSFEQNDQIQQLD